jgi:hypothetical protein
MNSGGGMTQTLYAHMNKRKKKNDAFQLLDEFILQIF